jgi:hypothetical protein
VWRWDLLQQQTPQVQKPHYDTYNRLYVTASRCNGHDVTAPTYCVPVCRSLAPELEGVALDDLLQQQSLLSESPIYTKTGNVTASRCNGHGVTIFVERF